MGDVRPDVYEKPSQHQSQLRYWWTYIQALKEYAANFCDKADKRSNSSWRWRVLGHTRRSGTFVANTGHKIKNSDW